MVDKAFGANEYILLNELLMPTDLIPTFLSSKIWFYEPCLTNYPLGGGIHVIA